MNNEFFQLRILITAECLYYYWAELTEPGTHPWRSEVGSNPYFWRHVCQEMDREHFVYHPEQ